MTETNICPRCGGKTVGGLCIDCGMADTLPSAEESAARAEERWDTDVDSLDDVTPPDLLSMSGDETISAEDALEAAEKAAKPADTKRESSNPYADVIPYERPDYGDNYIAPDVVTKVDGIPTGHMVNNDPNMLISRKVKLKHDRTWYSYWWLLLIVLLMPCPMPWLAVIPAIIGMALLRFDEKGARQAGIIALIITAVKFIIVNLI